MGAIRNEGKWEPVYVSQDDTGDWFIIPMSLADSFSAYMNGDMDDDYDLQEEFEAKFGKYRTGADLNNKQLYINRDE